MKKASTDIVKAFTAFTNDNRYDTPEESSAAFMQYLSTLAQEATDDANDGPDAEEYLDMAEKAASRKKAVEYAQRALQLDPTLTQARLLLLMNESSNDNTIKAGIEALLDEEQQRAGAQGNTGAHTLLRIYSAYVRVLVRMGKLHKAADVCRHVLRPEHGNDPFFCHTLIAVCAMLEDSASAELLYNGMDHDGSAFMLLPMVALYYKLDDIPTAQMWLGCLNARCTNLRKTLQSLRDEDISAADGPLYGTCDHTACENEVCAALAFCPQLYSSISGFRQWMIDQLPKKAAPRGKHK